MKGRKEKLEICPSVAESYHLNADQDDKTELNRTKASDPTGSGSHQLFLLQEQILNEMTVFRLSLFLTRFLAGGGGGDGRCGECVQCTDPTNPPETWI